jgi:hypothetical protein
MISPQFLAIYQQHGPSTLRILHQSLNIEEKITALIRKQKILAYPEGTDFAGNTKL